MVIMMPVVIVVLTMTLRVGRLGLVRQQVDTGRLYRHLGEVMLTVKNLTAKSTILFIWVYFCFTQNCLF